MAFFDPHLLERRLAALAPPQREVLLGREDAGSPLEVFPYLGAYNQWSRRLRPLGAARGRPRLKTLLAEPWRIDCKKLYVHIPFCRSRCLYCGFFMRRWNPVEVEDYLELLERELSLVSRYPWVAGSDFDAVYLGGGTPSDLEPHQLSRLLEAVRRHLPLKPGAEITLEGRLLGFDRARRQAALAGGVNRFSFGVQTFDDELRSMLGRRLGRQELKRLLGQLRQELEAPVAIDLIYGLPGQGATLWERDLEDFVDCGLAGLSLYALRMVQHNPLDLAIKGGLLPPEADTPTQGALALQAARRLEAAGFQRLDLIHWRSTPDERCLYELRLKGRSAILGLGWGSHSELKGLRLVNHLKPAAYAALVRRGRLPVMLYLAHPEQYPLYHEIHDQLCRGSLRLKDLGEGLAGMLEPFCRRWCRLGLMEAKGEHYRLTEAGWFFGPNLIQSLLDLLDMAAPDYRVPAPSAAPRHFSLYLKPPSTTRRRKPSSPCGGEASHV